MNTNNMTFDSFDDDGNAVCCVMEISAGVVYVDVYLNDGSEPREALGQYRARLEDLDRNPRIVWELPIPSQDVIDDVRARILG